MPLKSPDLLPSIRTKPYHLRLEHYLKRRTELFNVNSIRSVKSRSSARIREFWKRKRPLRKYMISAIVNKKHDIRPFTNVDMLGESVLALLDSGANKSIIGGSLAFKIVLNNSVFHKLNSSVRTADGQTQTVAGTITVPLTYNSIKSDFEFLVVPSIKKNLICGMDFWDKFGISINSAIKIDQITYEKSEDSPMMNLTASQKSKLQSVVDFFPSFDKEGLDLTKLIEHSIDTADAKPIKQRFYPLSPAKEKLLCLEIDPMIKSDVIEEAPSSSWSSPVTLHIKPGKIRFCLDARKLNAVTGKDAYPIPRIQFPEEIKLKLCSAPCLIHPNYDKSFIVQCDASLHGVGAVLSQCDESGCERPISFMSKKLNKAQRNYTVTEVECLAVVLAIKKFRMYIDGHDFKVVTDHASLRWLMNQSDLSGRLARWAFKLQGYNFEIEHRKGSENVVADALSRSFEDADDIAALDFDVIPEIDLESEAFQDKEYVSL